MLTLLAFIASNTRASHPTVSELVATGALNEAVAHARLALDKRQPALNPLSQAELGRLLGYALLALGRDVEAEEVFTRQRKWYSDATRESIRCNSTLDQAALMLAQHRLSRAAQNATAVIDDAAADAAQRAEALAILSVCLNELGEHDACQMAIAEAQATAQLLPEPAASWALGLLELEQLAKRIAQPSHAQSHADVAMCLSATDPSTLPAASIDDLMLKARQFSRSVSQHALLFQCLMQVQSLAWAAQGDAEQISHLFNHVRWLHERGATAAAENLRVEAALALLAAGNHGSAHRFIEPLVADESRIGRHRQAMALHFCMATLHAHAGRAVQALHAFNEHAMATTRLLRSELTRIKLPREMADRQENRATSAEALRLPPRYRAAYRFVMEHLGDAALSVAMVAEQISVTPRMLQIAFRDHLGTTPTELIRTMRLRHIRAELATRPGHEDTMEVANRWGISSRSTLSRGLRASQSAGA